MASLSPPNRDMRDIFTTFFNAGGWSTKGLSVCVGLRGFAVVFLGADGAIHVAEEVGNSTLNVPRSLIVSIPLNGCLGFAILIVFLLCADDLQAVLESGSAFPFIEIIVKTPRQHRRSDDTCNPGHYPKSVLLSGYIVCWGPDDFVFFKRPGCAGLATASEGQPAYIDPD
ncbi:hypothetical protein VTN96DRAFT_5740 [Rasamsonia emersonii]|uniref:Uncharacterized protein n=1 Tax=Rasamsonia emersonii (strain ATCC 16479 / CBS 393.64 / IMI 116815) TaxID=1408163 RepID=A0A0F4YHZ5_RASE3|nr:hypothetical protein T310_8218 [Rasamsonia emersonii CBS 393.64]KKA17839.1 hypothetical protein T310_8218 [Rasamsonia emersonii CBS 393.64]